MGATGVLLDLLVDSVRYVRGKDLHECGGGQPPHGVVLDGSPWQVGIRHEGEVIDSPAMLILIGVDLLSFINQYQSDL